MEKSLRLVKTIGEIDYDKELIFDTQTSTFQTFLWCKLSNMCRDNPDGCEENILLLARMFSVSEIVMEQEIHTLCEIGLIYRVVKDGKTFIEVRALKRKKLDKKEKAFPSVIPSKESLQSKDPLSVLTSVNVLATDQEVRRVKVSDKEDRLKKAGYYGRRKERVAETETTTSIMELWNNLGLKTCRRTKTKVHKETNIRIKRLMKGQMFDVYPSLEQYHQRKFSEQEIKTSIINFSRAINEDIYKPREGTPTWNWYRGLRLHEFFLCNSEAKNPTLSLFLKYLFQPIEVAVDDEYPALTKAIREMYIDKCLGGTKAKMSPRHESNFRRAGSRMEEFLHVNKRLVRTELLVGDRAEELALLLFDAIEKDRGDLDKITPGWLCSDNTFSIRLPLYLKSEGMLEEEVPFAV